MTSPIYTKDVYSVQFFLLQNVITKGCLKRLSARQTYLIQDGVGRVGGHARGDVEQHLERECGHVGRAHAAAAAAAQAACEAHVAF